MLTAAWTFIKYEYRTNSTSFFHVLCFINSQLKTRKLTRPTFLNTLCEKMILLKLSISSELTVCQNPAMCCSTLMLCGHSLVHHDHHPPCCDISTKPVRHLQDTCADCHPPIRVARTNREHDSRRKELVRLAGQAASKEEAIVLDKAIKENENKRRLRLYDAMRIKWDGNVDWGGQPEEQEMMWDGSLL